MPIEIGKVAGLFRYAVKSMRGESMDVAELGWHGVAGDRRLAFRRLGDRHGFPWLTASKLQELVLFEPVRRGGEGGKDLPTHVRTPEGEEFELFGQELAADVGRRHGSPVEMMYLDRGIFDEAPISVITNATVDEIAKLAGHSSLDVRRFRPNIVVALSRAIPFDEDGWVGGILSFGDANQGPAIYITNRDERCSMVNIDPNSARPAPEVMKVIVRERNNKAGVYGNVARRGRLAVGQAIFFQ